MAEAAPTSPPATPTEPEPAPGTRRDAVKTVTLILILALAVWMRLRALDGHSFWFDEAVTVWMASKPLGQLLADVRYWERTPPLHYLLVSLFVRPLGVTEVTARMPSVMAGVASVWLVYVIGRRLFGWRAGAAAALLMAVSPYQILYSQEARAYMLMQALALGSCALYLRLLDARKGAWTKIGYAIVTALMLYAHLYGAPVVLVQNGFYAVLWLTRNKPELGPRAWAGLQAAVVLLFAPWLPTTIWWTRSVAGTFWVERFTINEITRTLWAYAGSGPALILVAALTVIAGWRVRNRRGWVFCVLLATTPVVIPVLISLIKTPMFTNRYGIAAAPWLCLLAGAGIAELRWRAVQLTVLVCLSMMPLMRIDPAPENLRPGNPRDDWRGLGRYMQDTLRPGDYVAINAGGAILAYGRYVDRRDVEVAGFADARVPVPLLRRPGSRVWLIVHTPMTPLRDILASGDWRVVSRKRFSAIDVLELEGPQGPATVPQSVPAI